MHHDAPLQINVSCVDLPSNPSILHRILPQPSAVDKLEHHILVGCNPHNHNPSSTTIYSYSKKIGASKEKTTSHHFPHWIAITWGVRPQFVEILRILRSLSRARPGKWRGHEELQDLSPSKVHRLRGAGATEGWGWVLHGWLEFSGFFLGCDLTATSLRSIG